MIFSMQDHKEKPFLETEFDETGARFSPDGQWLLYTSNESGQNESYLVPFPGPGGKWQVSTGGSYGAEWSHRGNEIFYGNRDESIMVVPVQMEGSNVQIGSPQKLFQDQSIWYWSPAPNGEGFLILQRTTETLNSPITVVTNWVSTLKN